MEENTVIKIENMSKKFCRSLRRSMAYGTLDLVNNFLGIPIRTGRLRKGEFWALDNINFELKKGESLGIIGTNGSGKSTLLRMITGIYPPDVGKISVRGKIGALIAVGAGFHPHLSGRENIYLNGTILGMTQKEIDAKFQDIIDFADIGEFLDAPVSTYSSGMRVRLGFAIAVHCEPDILLVDEILSVGDLSFRNKSLRHMAEFRKKANALIFVSHDTEQIRNLCSRVIVIDKGKMVYDGNTSEGIIKFEEISRGIRLANLKKELEKKHVKHFDSEDIDVKNIKIVNSQGKKTSEVELGKGIQIEIEFEVKNDIESLSINVPIVRDDNVDVYCINLFSDMKKIFEQLTPGKYVCNLVIEKHNLNPGVYYFGTITFRNNKTLETFNKSRFSEPFRVISDGETFERGFINVNSNWNLEKL